MQLEATVALDEDKVSDPAADIVAFLLSSLDGPEPAKLPVVVDEGTVTGIVNKFFVPPAVYDVHFVNGDGQAVTLVAGLVVQ